MQVQNSKNTGSKYTDNLLSNQGSISSMEQGVSLIFKFWSAVIGGIKKYFFPFWNRAFATSAGEHNHSNPYAASNSNKEQPQMPVTSPNTKDENEYFGNKFKYLYDFFHSIRTKVELLRIRKKINQLQRIIDAPKMLRPSYGVLGYDMNSYFIEIDRKGIMRLIETEQNRVHEVRRTKDLDELLYWIFTNITFSMACTNKSGNNADSYDHRRQIFLRQEELLGKLNPHWKEKKHAEYKELMKKYPADNLQGDGPAYFEALRKLIRIETVENSPNYFRFP